MQSTHTGFVKQQDNWLKILPVPKNIVEEVRKERESHAAKFNYDIRAIYEDIKKQEKKSNRKFVTLPPKYAKKSA